MELWRTRKGLRNVANINWIFRRFYWSLLLLLPLSLLLLISYLPWGVYWPSITTTSNSRYQKIITLRWWRLLCLKGKQTKPKRVVRGVSLWYVGRDNSKLLFTTNSVPPSIHAMLQLMQIIFYCGSPDFVNWSESGTLESECSTVTCIINMIVINKDNVSVSLNHNNKIGYKHFLFSDDGRKHIRWGEAMSFMQLGT